VRFPVRLKWNTVFNLQPVRAAIAIMKCDASPVLFEYLNLIRPRTLLGVGQGAIVCVHDYQLAHPECQTAAVTELANLPDQHFDTAIVLDCIEYLDKSAARHLIARLRDALAVNLLVAVPLGKGGAGLPSQWVDGDFLALGMQLHAQLQCDGGTLGVYRFAIYDYKPVPDWLNAKYWAHPERWKP
jgi:hypothetical protein